MAARFILVGLVVVLAGAWLRYTVLTHWLREDLEALISNERLVIASFVASGIDDKLIQRRDLLQRMAEGLVTDEALANLPNLQSRLVTRQYLFPMFDLGLQLVDREGRTLVGAPVVDGRPLQRPGGEAFIREAFEGRAAVSAPGAQPGTSVAGLAMAVPVRDPFGGVRAVMIGTVSLQALDLLQLPSGGELPHTGGLLLISPRDKLFVASSDASMTMKPVPPPGVNSLHDRAMAGYRGTGITVNARGVEELSAMVSVPSVDWFVVARIPTAEAFAAIQRTKAVVLRGTLGSLVLVLLLVGATTWWVLGPLFRAAAEADAMTRGDTPLQPLKVTRDDEIGHLTTSFNRLIAKLSSSQDELQRLAHHDSLTGLPNRRLLNDRLRQGLARSRRHGTWLAVLALDLDGFKPINDVHGHEAGDEALRLIGRRFTDALRENDTLARVGGDEFVLLATDLADHRADAVRGVQAIADKLIAIAAQPLAIGSAQVQLGVSIGMAVTVGDETQAAALLAAADRAMYEAKQAGRGRHHLAEITTNSAAAAAVRQEPRAAA